MGHDLPLEGVKNAADLRTRRCRPEKSYADLIATLVRLTSARRGEHGSKAGHERSPVHAPYPHGGGMVGRTREVSKVRGQRRQKNRNGRELIPAVICDAFSETQRARSLLYLNRPSP